MSILNLVDLRPDRVFCSVGVQTRSAIVGESLVRNEALCGQHGHGGWQWHVSASSMPRLNRRYCATIPVRIVSRSTIALSTRKVERGYVAQRRSQTTVSVRRPGRACGMRSPQFPSGGQACLRQAVSPDGHTFAGVESPQPQSVAESLKFSAISQSALPRHCARPSTNVPRPAQPIARLSRWTPPRRRHKAFIACSGSNSVLALSACHSAPGSWQGEAGCKCD